MDSIESGSTPDNDETRGLVRGLLERTQVPQDSFYVDSGMTRGLGAPPIFQKPRPPNTVHDLTTATLAGAQESVLQPFFDLPAHAGAKIASWITGKEVDPAQTLLGRAAASVRADRPATDNPKSQVSAIGNMAGQLPEYALAGAVGGPAGMAAVGTAGGLGSGLAEVDQPRSVLDGPEPSVARQTAFVLGKGILGSLMGLGPLGSPGRAMVTTIEKELGQAGLTQLAFGVGDYANRKLTIDPSAQLDPEELVNSVGAALLVAGAGHGATKLLEKPAGYQEAVGKAAEDAGVPIQERLAAADADAAAALERTKAATPESGVPEQPQSSPQETPKDSTTAEPAPTEAPVSTQEAGPERVTGVANEPVDVGRAEAGLPAAEHGPFRSDESVHAKAVEKMTADPEYGQRLIGELKDEPRPTSTDETAALSLEIARLSKEREDAQVAFEQEQTPDTQARVTKAQADYDTATQVATTVGTEASQAFRLRQWLLKNDYSLAAITRRARVEAGGEIPPELDARISELAKRVADTEKAFEDYVAGEPARRSEHAVKPTIRQYIKKQADSARVRMKERLRTPQMNLDPQAIADLAFIGADHIANGISEFGAWSQKMLEEFPEVKEHLQTIYDKAQEAFSASPRAKAYKSRLKTETAKLQARAAEGDVAPKTREPMMLDDEAVALKAEHEKAKQQVQKLYYELQQANRSRGKIAADAAREIIDLPRAVWSSYDLSAVLRQGAFFTVGHPIQSIGHIKAMLKAAVSPEFTRQMDVRLRTRPGAQFGEMSKLDLTHHGDSIGTHEEAIRSRLSDKIPGIPASNRAFVTFLNMQRAAMFDEIVRSLPGPVTLAEGRAIANLVNVGTGRGAPGQYAGAVRGLQTVLWAPRLLLSRFQLIAGQPLMRGNARTRTAVAKEYARFLIGMGTIYTMGAMLGAQEEKDPRSADFGKLKFGDTRIDPLAGLAQVTRLVSEVGTGERKDAKGRVRSIRGNVPYGQPNTFDVLADFGRTKLTPLIGLGIDIAAGESMTGEKTDAAWVAKQAVPLSFRDIYDSMRDQGVAKGAALGILSLFGMGLQTYERRR